MSILVGSVSVEVVPSARGFREKLAAALKDLPAAKVNVEAQVDDKAAKAELDVLARDRKVNVKADTDRNSFATAGKSLSGLSGGIGGIAAAGLALGPALIPVAAGLTVAFAGLAAPIAIAAAGVGSFALFAVPAVTAVTKASAAMAKAQLAVNNALTPAARSTALARQAQLMKSLSPATAAAAKSLDTFKATFKGFQTALAPQIFGVFNAGLGAATALLPSLAQIARGVAPALKGLADSAGAFFRSADFKSFVGFVAQQAGPIITTLGTILGNVARGFGSLLTAFAPVGAGLLDGISRLSAGFANIGASQGFRGFLDYAKASLPLVGKFLGDLVGAVSSLAVAFAPYGTVILRVLDVVLQGITSIARQHPAIAGLAVVFGAVALALIPLAPAIGVIASVIGAISGTAVLAGVALAGLAAILVTAYQRSAPFRRVIGEIATVLRDLALKALPVVQTIFRKAMDGIRAGIDTVSAAITRNRSQIDELIRGFKTLASFVLTKVVPVLGPILKAVIVAIGTIIGNVITAVGALVRAFNAAKGPVIEAFKAVAAAGKFMWENVLRPAFKSLVDTFLAVAGAIVNGAARAFGWVPGIGGKLKTAAAEFGKFRDTVNDHMAGVTPGRTVTVTGKAIIDSNSKIYAAQGAKNLSLAHLAQGGPVPMVFGAQRGKDSVPILAMPGEFVIREAVARENYGLLAALNAGTLPRYAAGGLIPTARTPGAPLPGQMAQGVSDALAAGVGAALKAGLAAAAAQAAKAAAVGAFGGGGSPIGGAVGGGAARWLPTVLQVLHLLGQSGANAPAVLRRINFESGGNPNAINLTDINAQRGDPSIGLMQVIGSTFRRWAGPFVGLGQRNGLASIYAGTNYGLHRYGSIAAIDPLVRPRGYDSGGMLPTGLSLAYNGTGRPEPVGHNLVPAADQKLTVNLLLDGSVIHRQLVKLKRSNGGIQLGLA